MCKSFLLKIIVIFIVFEVVSNQLTDQLDFPKLWFDKLGKRITAPDQFPDISAVSIDKTNNRGMVGDVTQSVKAFIKGGLCLTKCIWGYLSDCPGAVSCGWKCVAPPDKSPPNNSSVGESPPDNSLIDNQNDNDIQYETFQSTPDTGGTKSEDLSPNDIVFFFICFMKCMTKYLPFNKPRLQQFIICLSFKCFCTAK